MPGLDEEDESLASSLLPSLLHEIAGSAQYVTSLSGFLAHGGAHGAAWTARATGALDEFRRDVRDQGYLLGLLGAELGANLLRARREPRALTPLVALVRRALRRHGRDLAPGPESLPLVRGPGDGEGWEAAWALGTWLLAGGLAQPPQSTLSWKLVRSPQAWEVVISSASSRPERLQRAQARIEARLRAVRFEAGMDSASMILPAEWLSPDR